MQTYADTHSTAEGGAQLAPSRLLIVSNRGPIEFTLDDKGTLRRRPAGGGLATALSCIAGSRPVTWIASAVTEGDRMMASKKDAIGMGDDKHLRLVAPSREAHELAYGTFCNPILWFLQHSMWDQLQRDDLEAEALDAWQRGYMPVNRAFADAVVDEIWAGRVPCEVMLHDYHLYLAPFFIRQQAPYVALQHFVHIPWPSAAAWHVLPRTIVRSICEAMLANDSVTFHTQAFADNFIETCRAYVPEIHRVEGDAIEYDGRRTRVWANPISVDVFDLQRQVASSEAEPYRRSLEATPDVRTIVRVDRLDPSKNVLGGFDAFELLLQHHPEWKGRVRFLAFLVPTRSKIPEYRRYSDEVFARIEGINARYGRPDWTPITVFHENNRLQALVAMTLYDVLLVNPLRDGMNLVSKEGPVVNQRDGALVLSHEAGAFAELRDGALPVHPEDAEETAEALHTALTMPPEERRGRSLRLRKAILQHDIDKWLELQLDDLNAIEHGDLSRFDHAIAG